MNYSAKYLFFSKLRHLGLLSGAREAKEVKEMLNAIKKLEGGKIKFELEFDEDGNWAVESLNAPGIITGGTFNDNIQSVVNDAIFIFYAIPPKYCDDSILLENHEKTATKHSSKGTQAKHVCIYESSPAPAFA